MTNQLPAQQKKMLQDIERFNSQLFIQQGAQLSPCINPAKKRYPAIREATFSQTRCQNYRIKLPKDPRQISLPYVEPLVTTRY